LPDPAPPPIDRGPHHAHLLALNDALRPLAKAVDILVTASRLLGERLGAQRVAYFDVQGPDYYIERDYARGVTPFAGRYPIQSFGQRLLMQYRSGQTAVARDVQGDPMLSAEQKAAYAGVQVGAYIGVPLIKNGEFVGGLGVHARYARDWTAEEIALAEATAERTWAAVERARAEEALSRSERHYRLLFDNIDQGMCTIEVLFDDQGRAADYRFLQTNAAFERQTGLADATGKRMRELAADHEEHWFEIYGEIARSGEPRRFEHAAASLGRFYDVYAFRIGTPLECKVAILFNDITERKRREANLAFLADVSHELALFEDIDATMGLLSARIGAHLQASHCAFAEISEDGETAEIRHAWHRADVRGIEGTHRIRDYLGDAVIEHLRQGHPIVVDDVNTERRVHARQLQRLQAAALVGMPASQGGRWRFLLAVQHSEPHAWRPEEIELIEEVSARIWTRLEQARAEQALKVSDERLRALFSQMLGGVAETDLDGRFTRVNHRYCEILGYSPEELLGMRMVDVLHPEDRAVHRAKRERLLRLGEPFETEKRYVRKDGEVVWVRNSVSRLSDGSGHVIGMISVSLDISERHRQQEQLRRGAAMLDFLIQHSPNGFYIVDADLRISHINAESQARAFRHVYPAVGRSLDEAMRVIWPEPLATELIGRFRHTLETGEPYVSDLVARRADLDAVETYTWQLQRITMPDGRRAVVCFYYDTTRLRQVEQELREADQAKDEFLATLAHELRNPLAPIRNSLHLLRQADRSAGSARVHDMLERQVSHLVRLVDDLMEVSRITRGQFELRRQRMDLAEAVQSALETSRPLIDAAGHTLNLSLSPEPLPLDADAVRLAQLLANLLNNAAKYTDAGGHIWLSTGREGDQAWVSVRDNGTGIPAEQLARVFDLFMQADNSQQRAQGGLGIGLTLAQRIAQMHGGSVRAHSEGPGRGSEFVVRLPLAASPALAGAGAARSAPVLAPLRILVVDDNQDSADSLGLLLQSLGAEAHAVYDGPSALDALGRERPALVFLDIGLPGMDGYEVAARMRRTQEGRQAKLVALSGWAQQDDLRRSQAAGFDRHLVKPVDLGTLTALLATVAAAAT